MRRQMADLTEDEREEGQVKMSQPTTSIIFAVCVLVLFLLSTQGWINTCVHYCGVLYFPQLLIIKRYIRNTWNVSIRFKCVL